MPHTPTSPRTQHRAQQSLRSDRKQPRSPLLPSSGPVLSTARQKEPNTWLEEAVILCRYQHQFTRHGRALPTPSGCGVGDNSSGLGAARADRRGGIRCQPWWLFVVVHGLARSWRSVLLVERRVHITRASRLLQPRCVDTRERRQEPGEGEEWKGEGRGIFAGRGSPRGGRVSVHYQGELDFLWCSMQGQRDV